MFRLAFLCLLVAALSGFAPVAHADTVQRVRFAQSAIVIVWDKQGQVQKGQSVTIGRLETIAPADYLVTGELLPVPASNGITGNTMTLRLASNAPVILQATSNQDVSDIQVRVIERGSNASTAFGTMLTDRISNSVPTEIYQLSSKTAKRRGSAISQSIELEISWSGSPEAEIVITALAQ